MTPLLCERAAAIEAQRKLTADVLDALHERELFRLTLPAHAGGYELPIPVLASVTEIIAGADASTAWCLGQAFGCAISAAFLDKDAAREVFGPPDAVLAWGAGAQGTAVAIDGGYRVNGTWKFASGAKHATWLGGHCKGLRVRRQSAARRERRPRPPYRTVSTRAGGNLRRLVRDGPPGNAERGLHGRGPVRRIPAHPGPGDPR